MYNQLGLFDSDVVTKMSNLTGVKYSDEQKAILNAKGGLCIISAAGSGKTTILTHLIAKRILTGEIANPHKLLCTTYSKAGADEMSDRINKLLKKLGLNYNITVKTLHASYYQVLKAFGLMKNICTNAQRKMLIKEACTENKIRLEEDDMNTLDSLLSYQINYLLTDKNLTKSYVYTLENLSESEYTAIRQSFNKKKEEAGLIDFDDMQLYMYNLLCVQKNQRVIDYCRSQWEYFYVDEFQDTSRIQFAILQAMVTDPKKLVVIGDDDQCLVEGTIVKTHRGYKPIEDIQPGDWVYSGIGGGETKDYLVDAVSKRKITGEIVVIKTKGGREIKGTNSHIGFARIIPENNVYYTYLMYKKDFGFRIGTTSGVRNGIDVGLMQEKADKLWILKRCATKEESLYWESYYAYKYSIPMYRFVANEEGSAKTALSLETIKQLHSELDTFSNGLRLLEDMGMLYEYPHRIPQATGDRYKINFSMFSSCQVSKYGMHKSELEANSSNEDFVNILREYLSTTVRKKSDGDYTYYNSRSTIDDIDKQMDIIKKVEEDCKEKGIYLEVNRDAKFNENKYMFMPFGNMIEGMMMPVINGDTVEEDEIISVTKEQYDGYVYDISVPDTRNFIANDIVVHNCIYSWRGADPNIILNICAYYDIEKYFLNTNYRCGENIVKIAETGIKHMPRREAKQMVAHRPGGKIEILPASGSGLLQLSFDALNHIKRELARGVKPSEICVLARNNSHVAILGNLLLREGIYCTAAEDMKISNLPLFKDLVNILEMSKDTYNTNMVKTYLWKVVPFLGLKGGQAVYEFMQATGCSLKNSLGYILINYCYRQDINWSGKIKISDRVDYKIEAMMNKVNFKAINGLVEIYNILCSEDELERVSAFLYMFQEASGFLYGTQDRMRTLIGMTQYFKYMCTTYGIEDTQAFLRLTEQYESGKMAVSGDTITLSTIHGAKGMEWRYVIQFADDNISFPSFEGIVTMLRKGISEKDIHIMIDSERRLHYVAQTRAIEKWTLLADVTNISVLALESLGIMLNYGGSVNNDEIINLARRGGLNDTLIETIYMELRNESSPYAYSYRKEVLQDALKNLSENSELEGEEVEKECSNNASVISEGTDSEDFV